MLANNRKHRQLCLTRTDVDRKSLSGLGKIRIMRIGIICLERDPSNLSDLDENPDYTYPE